MQLVVVTEKDAEDKEKCKLDDRPQMAETKMWRRRRSLIELKTHTCQYAFVLFFLWVELCVFHAVSFLFFFYLRGNWWTWYRRSEKRWWDSKRGRNTVDYSGVTSLFERGKAFSIGLLLLYNVHFIDNRRRSNRIFSLKAHWGNSGRLVLPYKCLFSKNAS